jgi:acyl dehydratase
MKGRSVTVSHFADIDVGQDVPQLDHLVDKLMIIKYCAAGDDWGRVHWDEAWVAEQGFPALVVQGWLTFALMCQAVTNWIPREIADISKYAVRYLAPNWPGPMSCGGTVVAKREEDGEKLVDLELWAKDGDGKVTTTAAVTVKIQ